MENTPETGLSRRDALKTLGAGLALAGLGGFVPRARAAADAAPALGWELPPLAFDYGALEPHLDARTMEIHHTRHHQAYINNARRLLEGHPDLLAQGPEALVRDLARVPEAIRTGIRNNAGGHVNHAFFWRHLSPQGGGAPVGRLAEEVRLAFGGFEAFQAQFNDAAMRRFGSGWAWLSYRPQGGLVVHSTANQDSPLMEGLVPVLGLDVWEHAYYLHYQNRRGDYVAAFWQVVDWNRAEANFVAATVGA